MRDGLHGAGDHGLGSGDGGPAAVDAGEEAGAVEGEGEVQVILCGGDRGEAEFGLGGVLEVRAHVGDVKDGRHGCGWLGMGV